MGSSKASEFETTFTYTPTIPYERGITRRDPSPVIRVDSLYYVWYSKATADETGYCASVWYATSSDGKLWTERGEAIPKGGTGAWDENGVFTPTTLIAKGRYYLIYTAIPKPVIREGEGSTSTALGAAFADSPAGPWEKFSGNPILATGEPGAWDSHRIDDACMIVREGKYWLYYKGRERGKRAAETKMGVAIASDPLGPYVKHPENPLIGSGHEVCVWPHRWGVAAMIAPCGPEGKTVQFSPDGLHFTVQSRVDPPSAPGPFRYDGYVDSIYGVGIDWGISQDLSKDRPFLVRFDCSLLAEDQDR